MTKYEALTEHLSRVKGSQCRLSFAEIEKIIGDPLPASARKHRAWWSNNPDNSVITKAWLVAGWISSDVDMTGMKLVFRRDAERGDASALARKERIQEARNVLSLDAIPDEIVRILKLRAQIGGQTIERLATDILIANANLSVKERLSLADTIRTKSPPLHELDVPAMIREDRNRQ